MKVANGGTIKTLNFLSQHGGSISCISDYSHGLARGSSQVEGYVTGSEEGSEKGFEKGFERGFELGFLENIYLTAMEQIPSAVFLLYFFNKTDNLTTSDIALYSHLYEV